MKEEEAGMPTEVTSLLLSEPLLELGFAVCLWHRWRCVTFLN